MGHPLLKNEYSESFNFGMFKNPDLIVGKPWGKDDAIIKGYLEWYFSGPDLRYHGSFFTICIDDIAEWTKNIRKAYQKYEELKSKNPTGEVHLNFNSDIHIWVNVEYGASGVCMSYNKFGISTTQKLEQFITKLELAKIRTEEIKKEFFGETGDELRKENTRQENTRQENTRQEILDIELQMERLQKRLQEIRKQELDKLLSILKRLAAADDIKQQKIEDTERQIRQLQEKLQKLKEM